MCQVSDFADSLNKPEGIFVDKKVFNDVRFNLCTRILQTHILGV